MLTKTIITMNQSAYEKHATLYFDNQVSPDSVLLYFHGGGLLYGLREDLPQTHLSSMTENGFAVIAFDYPLAPAAGLDVILKDVCESVNDYITDYGKYTGSRLPYFLWGRSAGAYLCLLAAAKGNLSSVPAGVVSYYGYGFLCDQWYQEPSPGYLCLPPVDASCLENTLGKVHASGPMDTHYSNYVYARQTGNWRNLIFRGSDKDFLLDYSLRTSHSLPCRLFAAHATRDPDVPYTEFQELCNRFNPVRSIAVSDIHDFDRLSNTSATQALLTATLAFLKNGQS